MPRSRQVTQARFDRIFALAAGAAFFAVLLGLLVWFGNDSPPDSTPTPPLAVVSTSPSTGEPTPDVPEPTTAPAPTSDGPPTPASTAEAATDPSLDEPLEELRATEAFVVLTEHDRAQGDPAARVGYDLFAPHHDGEIVYEWANKAELWDGLVPGIRDQCLLAGAPHGEPLWDSAATADAGIDPGWSTVTTQGRGQFVDFLCRFAEPTTGVGVERWWAVLIADAELAGRVVARMPAFDVRAEEFASLEASRETIDLRLWSWVLDQPVVEAAELP